VALRLLSDSWPHRNRSIHVVQAAGEECDRVPSFSCGQPRLPRCVLERAALMAKALQAARSGVDSVLRIIQIRAACLAENFGSSFGPCIEAIPTFPY